jgi:hypothetical protein
MSWDKEDTEKLVRGVLVVSGLGLLIVLLVAVLKNLYVAFDAAILAVLSTSIIVHLFLGIAWALSIVLLSLGVLGSIYLLIRVIQELIQQVKAVADNLNRLSYSISKQAAAAAVDAALLAVLCGLIGILAFVATEDFFKHLSVPRVAAITAMTMGLVKVLLFARVRWMSYFSWVVSALLALALGWFVVYRLAIWPYAGFSESASIVRSKWSVLEDGQKIANVIVAITTFIIFVYHPTSDKN